MASKNQGKLVLTEGELDALIARKLAERDRARVSDEAPESKVPLSRCDHSERDAVTRALIHLAAAVGIPHELDGHTPFESALADICGCKHDSEGDSDTNTDGE